MSTFKKTKVVMLSTNEKAAVGNIVTRPSDNRMAIVNVLTINDPQPCIHQHLYFLSDEAIKEGDWYIHYQKRTGFYPVPGLRVQKCVGTNLPMDSKKIIATTDKSLTIEGKCWCMKPERGGCYQCNKQLPQPSQSFIEKFVEEYNKGNVITEVMVEYNETITEIPKSYKHYSEVELLDDTLKVNRDNTITIRKVKDSWSTEEMRQKLNDYRLYAKNSNLSIEMFDKWIEENL